MSLLQRARFLISILAIFFLSSTNIFAQYCTSGSPDCSGNYISNVTLGPINNSTVCSAGGYANYTATVPTATLMVGTSALINVTIVNNGFNNITYAWIDYNHDFTFSASEVVSLGSSNTTNLSATITVPVSALTGATRMRVRTIRGYSWDPAVVACGSAGNAETEDYAINIVPGVACSGAPTAGTVSGPATACLLTNFTLTNTGAIPAATAVRYAWQSSPDGTVWTNINNTGTLLYAVTVSQSGARYYRMVDTCTVSGLTAISNSIQVVMTPYNQCYCIPGTSNCGSFGFYSIDSVSFSNIHNASTCNGTGYSDFTTSVPAANVNAGTIIPIFFKLGGSSTKYVILAIDANRNGVFESSEIQQFGSSIGNLSALVRIPFNTPTGITRMRVRVSDYGTSVCNDNSNGETEDYSINISPPTTPGPYFAFYVKANATGLNNGSSWADAYNIVPDAINISGPGDTIKIAKGTYNSAISINTYRDSIIVWGGYPNTGNPGNAERNWALNQTIFNGGNSIFSIFPTNVSAYTQLHGIIMNNAGVNISGAASIVSCVFRNTNITSGQPTGASSIACSSGAPVIKNCYFLNNNALGYGRTVNCSGSSSPVFVNCVFAAQKGRTVFFATNSSPKLLNCVFFNNSMSSGYSSDPITSTATIVCQANSNLTVANNIFAGNKYASNLSYDSSDFVLSSSTINITNSITQSYRYGNDQLLAKDPKFVDSTNIVGADGFYFTNDDGLQLVNPCSIGINAGNNAAIAGYTTDMLGNPRIFQSVVDLGAFEVQTNLASIPSVLYVNALATGLNNGSSWANAFTSLQSAMQACSDTIKVAKGTYYPSNTNKNDFFWMENHRVILGGYPNTGNPGNAQRDFVLNQTNLSGNLPSAGGNKAYAIVRGTNVDSTSIIDGVIVRDAVNNYSSPSGAAVILNRYGNGIFRNTIFRNNLSGSVYGGAILVKDSSNPRFFDCTIDSNGALNNNSSSDYGAVSNVRYSNPLFKRCLFKNNTNYISSLAPYFGGAMYNDNASPVIDSCTFTKNTSNNFGGAIASFNNSKPQISNSIFRENIAKDGGAHLFNQNSAPVVTNTIFFDTAYTGAGGGVYNVAAGTPTFTKCEFTILNTNAVICVNNSSSPVFNKCVFAKSYGSGTSLSNINYSSPVYVNCIGTTIGPPAVNGNYSSVFMSNLKSFPSIINSTIVNHNAPASANTIINGDSSTLTLSNSVLWNNLSFVTAPVEISNGYLSTTNASNSITQQYGIIAQNGMLTGTNPKFIDITNPAGPDGKWFTADDGLQLCSCSPAINTGSNTSITGYTTDVLENARIANGVVDMGAYEFQQSSTVNKSFFVKASATGANNGSSWTNAYNNLQSAFLNPCADTIRIAKGIYKPASISRDSTFNVNRGLTILGGFPDFGNPTDAARNINLYPSVLSGDIGVPLDSTDNTRNVVWVHVPDTTVIIDGIVIERGEANGGGATTSGTPNDRFGGGLLATQNKNLKISNCTFRNNFGSTGAALFTASDIIVINKCVFTDNTSSQGALNVQSNNAKITNSVFIRNTANYGGGVYCKTNANFENCLFYKNKAQTGAGAYLEDNPSTKFTNCNFVRNNAITYGFGIGLYNSTSYVVSTANPKIRNSIFYDNTYGGFPTGYQYSDWVWVNGVNSGGAQFPMDVQYSAVTTSPPYVNNNIVSGGVVFKNIDTAVGTDNIWFTADDGLIPALCSNTYNKGDNASVVNIPFDIMDSARIGNGIVDVGAYEYKKAIINIVASDTVICLGTSVTFTATVLQGSPGAVFLWQLNGAPVGTNSGTYTSATLNNNDTVSVKLISTDPTCSSFSDTSFSNKIIIRVASSVIPAVNISASSANICSGTLVNFTAVPLNGGSTPFYQWKLNNANVGGNSNTYSSATLQNNDIVTVQLTSALSCANPQTVAGNNILMTVNSTPVTGVSISATNTSICAGTNVTFTAAPVNGGSLPVYQWQVNGINVGSNSNVYSSATLNNNDNVTVVMQSSQPCAGPNTSNVVVITVASPITPGVSIAASATAVCFGTNVLFTATPVNAGAAPVYQWQINGINVGTNSPLFTSTTLNNNDLVSVRMTSTASCLTQPTANSNVITMSVGSPVTPVVSITASSIIICAGNNVTFTAAATNGGAGATYQWKVNNGNVGTNSNVFSSATLQNNDIVTVELTSTVACATPPTVNSNSIVITVNSNPVTSVSINASSTSICSGTNVTFTAAPVNGGTLPVYQWQVNGVNTGGNSNVFSSSVLMNNDNVRVIMRSSEPCAKPDTSNVAVISVTSLVTPAATISASTNGICTGTAVSFTAVPINAGVSPAYQWQVNSVNVGTNNPVFTSSTLNNADQVKVIMTSTASCLTQTSASSNIITMNVGNPVTPLVSVSASSAVICAGSAVTFTASVTNGGVAPTYQWKVNSVNAGTNSQVFTTTSLQNNDIVTCNITVDPTMACVTSSSAVSNAVQITVNLPLQPSCTILSSGNAVCAGTLVTFTATAVNAGSSPVYSWKVNGFNAGANNPIFSSSNLSNNDRVICVVTAGSTGCVLPSIPSNVITMLVGSAPAVSIVPVPDPVPAGTQLQLNASAGGTGNSFLWTPSGLLVNPNVLNPITRPLDSTTTFYLNVTNAAGCSSIASVKINVNTLLALPSAFTPNNDGKNDVFRIPAGVSMTLIDFSIYDRSGFRVFTTNDINKGWNGKYQGNPFNTGSFVYIIKGVMRGNQVLLKGTFTLVR